MRLWLPLCVLLHSWWAWRTRVRIPRGETIECLACDRVVMNIGRRA